MCPLDALEDWTPWPILKWLIDDACGGLDRAKSPWSVVYGPAAAVVSTARRLGWSVASPFEWKSDVGVCVDLRVDSAAFVNMLIVDAVSRWRWRSVEHRLPLWRFGGFGWGAYWAPIRKVLKAKDSEDWGADQKGSLLSVVSGRPQHRLSKAGIVQNQRCRLCLDMPGGWQPALFFTDGFVLPWLLCRRSSCLNFGLRLT